MTSPSSGGSAEQEITERDWNAVQELLNDMAEEEIRTRLAEAFGQWKLGLRFFRRVEENKMMRHDPTPMDFVFHKACLCELMSFGHALKLAANGHRDEDLRKHEIRMEVVDAALSGLQNTFEAFHSKMGADYSKELSARIFDDATC